ncbi:hypothetical protein CONCODRAFT_76766 [Conidiobolus coronatus NRRL 28638]|uniref:Sensitive to high expression protein 9, mitochondrial n=1 Tax=Conidiobolus coronatus (strain ATCC 28846 / CBS 209.66 / NRRL 28638) TaxID=796925 RepID=A0A137PID5_CONC2|nr:hypothetical protein CONCODRAFT_76766 [Conidiobolus coronatus NRRL 28638]|eukprot:KXN74730.1 hypothetical protein CONCODRAFT_76766 [Conidiobolus coronatus NRRL 28638]
MIKINKIPKLNHKSLTYNSLKLTSYRKLSTNLRLQLNSSNLLFKKDIEIEEDIKKILQEHEDLKLKKEAEKREAEENNKLEEETKLKEESVNNNDNNSENVIILEAPKNEVVKEEKEPKVDTSETTSSEPIHLPPPNNPAPAEESKTTNEQPLQALLIQLRDKFDDISKQINNKREEIKNIDWDVYKQKFFDLLKLIGVNLNQVTGYDQIEKLKNNIKVYESEFEKINKELKRIKLEHEGNVNMRAGGQKEINNLLQRKHLWTDEDVTQFTQLYRNEHKNEQNEYTSKAQLKALESQVEQTYTKLIDSIRTRYHEEQLWSDKIRGASTYWTLALILVNLLAFILVHTWLEPRKRRRMVEQVSQEMDAMINKLEGDLKEKLSPLTDTIDAQKSIIQAMSRQLDDVDYKLASGGNQKDSQDISKILSELLKPDDNDDGGMISYQTGEHPVIQGIKRADPIILSVGSALIGSLITLSMVVFLY